MAVAVSQMKAQEPTMSSTGFRPVGEVEVDSRRRISMARLGIGLHENDRFRVEMADDGTLRLIPVTTITKRELEVLSNPERMASIRKGIEEAREGKTTAVDFSQYLDDEDDE